MPLTVTTAGGQLYTLEVTSDTTLEILQQILEVETSIPVGEQRIFHNARLLNGPEKTLRELGVGVDDVLLIDRRPSPSGHISRGSQSANIEQMRQRALNDPRLMQQLREMSPALANAARDNPTEFARLVVELEQQRRQAHEARLREIEALNADPFNVEAQRRIEEMIRQENVMANMEAALEYNPESFGTVHMLYVNAEVNGHPIKAFVDSGAQVTIMSPQCAEACGLMRLLDRRFAGVAKGVGTAKILGRIHSAQIRLGNNLYLPCSFTVVEGKNVDLLFGLDMLKRHQACIDLAKDALIISGQEIPFLPEHEIPKFNHIDPEEEEMLAKTGEAAQALASDVARGTATAATTSSASSSDTSEFCSEEKIQALVSLGVSREGAKELLIAARGNVDVAAAMLFT